MLVLIGIRYREWKFCTTLRKGTLSNSELRLSILFSNFGDAKQSFSQFSNFTKEKGIYPIGW